MTTKDIRLEQTCGACPEQYDAYVGDRQVGYLRLRWGYFCVEVPYDGKVVLDHQFDDHWQGSFEDDQREEWLSKAKQAILEALEAV